MKRNHKNKDALHEIDHLHRYRKDKNVICETDYKGFPTPNNKSPLEIVVDASEGFIPLWEKNMVLKWRLSPTFNYQGYAPADAAQRVKDLLMRAILAWGDAAPVRFKEAASDWDFEIKIAPDNCSAYGCTLARAFFPDAGRHDMLIYPQLFAQSEQEQVETLIHELGHIFGLRHFFAKVSEDAWPSEIFGTHSKFSIMNYGEDSILTIADKNDLKALYTLAWSDKNFSINSTPIKLFKPYHYHIS